LDRLQGTLEVVEPICNRVIVIAKGKILADVLRLPEEPEVFVLVRVGM